MTSSFPININLLDIDLSIDINWSKALLPYVGDYFDIISFFNDPQKTKYTNTPVPQRANSDGFLSLLEYVHYYLWIVESRSWSSNGLTVICKRVDPFE